MSTNSIFDGFTRGEVVKDSVVLTPGDYIARIFSYQLLTDRHSDLSGTKMKAEKDLPEWADPTPQMAVTYQGLEIDEESGEYKVIGVITHRYSGAGYVPFDELEDNKLDPEDYFESGTKGYAVHEETRERVIDEVRTQKSLNIVNQLCEAAGLPLGAPLSELKGKILQITVFNRSYEGRDIPRVKSPKALAVEEPVNAE